MSWLFLSLAAHAAPVCTNIEGTRPDPALPAGTVDMANPIEHIVIIMQENHSFDSYFGRLAQPQYYGGAVDGLKEELFNPDPNGDRIHPYHSPNLCVEDVGHGWNTMHLAWNGGKNDGFVTQNGKRAMVYYDQRDLPYYYELANRFAIGDRYYCSVLSQTFPNRYFLLAATAFGHVDNGMPPTADQWDQRNIFDLMDDYGVSWRYYTDTDGGYLKLFGGSFARAGAKLAKLADYKADLASGKLPQVVFVESNYEQNEDEHPNDNIQIGQAWVADKIDALLASPAWATSALFLTYDENGGFYDHVSPPEACRPDNIDPMLTADHTPGRYDRLGFRVPFIAVSPYAKRHYVSHVTYDHTSILKFIETKFNLPALTVRDANAENLMDVFDFGHPDYDVPALPSAVVDPSRPCPSDPNTSS